MSQWITLEEAEREGLDLSWVADSIGPRRKGLVDNSMQIRFNPMTSDTAELLVVREINGGHGSVNDYDNPVTSDVLRSVTVEEITEALRKLSGLVNNPDDLDERPPPF